ncbi:MAG: hypothetical protein FJW56_03250 [Actinobacteria bacterium]|nr:hypothetical protein [Actinomycetota bacterium]
MNESNGDIKLELELKKLHEENKSFKKEIFSQKDLITELKNQNSSLSQTLVETQRNINELIQQVQEQTTYQKDLNLNNLILEKEKSVRLETQLKEWQRIVDEMAHSINTDVFAALANLNDIDDPTAIKKAIYNITRIRDIANLIMWDLNKSRLPESIEILSVNLPQLIKTQIDSIKDGIDSLRLSIREHKSKLSQLVIPVTAKNECVIQIDDNIEPGLELIIKDLLRNAFQNTDEENPVISIEMFSSDDFIFLTITNNRLISEKELLWFNEGIEDDDIQMSKSAKVGLRLVKMWLKNLRINGKFVTNSKLNHTSIELQIPKVIKYEKI